LQDVLMQLVSPDLLPLHGDDVLQLLRRYSAGSHGSDLI
jgi:hypothetical protein